MPLEQIPDEEYTITADNDILRPDYLSLCPDDPFQFSDDDSTSTDDNNGNGYTDPLQPTFKSNGLQLMTLDSCEAGKAIDDDFDILDDKIDQWAPFPCEQEYRLAHWCVKYKLSRVAIDELMKLQGVNMNFTSAYTLYNKIDEMTYALGIYLWKSGKVSYASPVDSEALWNDGKTPVYYRDPVDCIEFLFQQSAFKEHMVYAPIKDYNELGERVYSEVHTCDWWWNEQV
jgi:hypothetical protein